MSCHLPPFANASKQQLGVASSLARVTVSPNEYCLLRYVRA